MDYDQVLAYFGSQRAIARAVGIKQPSVSNWKQSGVPIEQQKKIEGITLRALKVIEDIGDPECAIRLDQALKRWKVTHETQTEEGKIIYPLHSGTLCSEAKSFRSRI